MKISKSKIWLAVIVIILLLITIFVINKLVNNNDINDNEKNEYEINMEGMTISIETSEFAIEEEYKKIVLEDENEIKQIAQILNDLEFSTETCEGLNSYIITVNDNQKYGIETYSNYHITTQQGEAKLTDEQTATLEAIINKYFE